MLDFRPFWLILVLLPLGNLAGQGHVFPGDVNADGRVDQYDLLPMAFAFGSVGPSRPTGSGEDAEEILLPWSDHFPDGNNYIHADADGNGRVELPDFGRLFTNNGIIHDPEADPLPQTFFSSGHFDLFLNGGNHINPSTVEGSIEIPLSVSAATAENLLNGLALELSWDPTFVVSASFTYDPAWLGFDGQAISLINNEENVIEIAASRLGANPIIGSGILGTLTVIIVEDLVDLMPVDPDTTVAFIEIEGIQIVDGDFIQTQSAGQSLYFTGVSAVTSTSEPDREIVASVYPNPTRDQLRISGRQSFHTVELIDLLGRNHTIYSGPLRRELTLETKDLPAGTYHLRIMGATGSGIYRFIRTAE